MRPALVRCVCGHEQGGASIQPAPPLTRVVHEDVEPPKAVGDLLDHVTDERRLLEADLLADARNHPVGEAFAFGHLPRGLCEARLVAIGGGHGRDPDEIRARREDRHNERLHERPVGPRCVRARARRRIARMCGSAGSHRTMVPFPP